MMRIAADDRPADQGTRRPLLAGVLTERQRETCALAWADRLPLAAIAARQGITLSAVQHRLTRARRCLAAAGILPPATRLHPRRRFPVTVKRWNDV